MAEHFMRRKGYDNIPPGAIDKVDGSPIWYFRYELPEGELELEVLWNADAKDWVATVSHFERKTLPNDEVPAGE